jgi:uncharacterized protein YoxC
MPTWVGVVSAVSLLVIALASIMTGVAAVVMTVALKRFFQAVGQLAGPAVDDVRHLVATIRGEADGIVATSQDIRQRIVSAADAAQARLADLDALVEVIQGKVEEAVIGAGGALSDVRLGLRLWRWTRALLGPKAGGTKRPKKAPKTGRRRS